MGSGVEETCEKLVGLMPPVPIVMAARRRAADVADGQGQGCGSLRRLSCENGYFADEKYLSLDGSLISTDSGSGVFPRRLAQERADAGRRALNKRKIAIRRLFRLADARPTRAVRRQPGPSAKGKQAAVSAGAAPPATTDFIRRHQGGFSRGSRASAEEYLVKGAARTLKTGVRQAAARRRGRTVAYTLNEEEITA